MTKLSERVERLDGPERKYLQRALNALNRNEEDYPYVTVNGKLDAATKSALATFEQMRGSRSWDVLARAIETIADSEAAKARGL